MRIDVDDLAVCIECDLADQCLADAECLVHDGHTHSVNRQGLQDSAGDVAGDHGPVISAGQGGLENLEVQQVIVHRNRGTRTCRRVGNPTTGRSTRVRTACSRLFPGWRESGQVSGIGGTGDGQSDFRGPADGVGDKAATRLHSRELVRSDDGVAILILHRLGALYVVPSRTPPVAKLSDLVHPRSQEPFVAEEKPIPAVSRTHVRADICTAKHIFLSPGGWRRKGRKQHRCRQYGGATTLVRKSTFPYPAGGTP